MKSSLICPTQRNSLLTILLTSLLCVSFVSCNKKMQTNESGTPPATKLDHKADQCPDFAGEYARDGGAERKSFTIAPMDTGIQFTDSDQEWIVDGQPHEKNLGKQYTYQAACEGKTVIIDVKDGETYLGRIKYSKYGENQMLIETTALDSRLGESGAVVWDFKSKTGKDKAE